MPSKRCATSAKRSENCSSAPVTNRMACQSRFEIQVQASHRRILTAYSRLSTARNRAVWGLDCRSAGRLSKHITDDCGRDLTCHVALSLALLRLLIRPRHRSGMPLRIQDVTDVESSRHPDHRWRDAMGPLREMRVCARQRDPGYAVLSASVAIGRPCAPSEAGTMPASCALLGHDELLP